MAAHSQQADIAAFGAAYPQFETATVEELRAREYARLDTLDLVYLDYTGAGLYAESQLARHLARLRGSVFGNPHSTNPTSQLATHCANAARTSVLDFFGASPDEYTVAFTANATAALKLVGEAYPFGPGSRLLLTADNHNSVNGIREFARRSGADVDYAPIVAPDLRLDARALAHFLAKPAKGPKLFAYPAQSNFSGVQHPLEWVQWARQRGWDVLLDAAAFTPTNRLRLAHTGPDFVSISFYKLFGYPTGLGCLIARRESLAKLRRPWFAGGTNTVVSVGTNGHDLSDGEAAFEDGTIDFLGLPAIEIGLRYLADVGLDVIHDRVQALTGWLLDQLTALRHPDGAPLVRVYGPTSVEARGGTVTFNVLTPDGTPLDYRTIEAEAGRWRISLRSGCFCNPGASEAALGVGLDVLQPLFDHGRPSPKALRRRHAYGAVRASVGIATTPADLARLVALLRKFADYGTNLVAVGHKGALVRQLSMQ